MLTPPIKTNLSSGRWADIWIVESESRPGVFYNVGRTAGDEYGCSCPAWTRHYPREDCKHVRHVKNWLARHLEPDGLVVNVENLGPVMRKSLSRFALAE